MHRAYSACGCSWLWNGWYILRRAAIAALAGLLSRMQLSAECIYPEPSILLLYAELLTVQILADQW